MRKIFKNAIKNPAKVTTKQLRIIWRNTKGGSINERQNHGGCTDLLFGSPPPLPRCPASPENLVDAANTGGDHLSSYRHLPFVAEQT